jgi:hypothetical protein
MRNVLLEKKSISCSEYFSDLSVCKRSFSLEVNICGLLAGKMKNYTVLMKGWD